MVRRRVRGRARAASVERDGFGNVVAWYDGGNAGGSTGRPAGVLTGSHLDSVLDGGAYDGPLGVVSAFAAMDVLRERASRPRRPIGVAMFVEEEGSRFGLACLGSRLATGRMTSWEQAGSCGTATVSRWLDAMSDGRARAGRPVAMLDRSSSFVELHVEQGRDLVDRGVAVGVAIGELGARPLALRLRRRAQPCRRDPAWRTGATRC